MLPISNRFSTNSGLNDSILNKEIVCISAKGLEEHQEYIQKPKISAILKVS